MPVTEQQIDIIREQIGREPEGLMEVVATSKTGTPLSLRMRSLVNDVPFPTLYWLSSKELCKAIGQIEGRGWVKQIEARIEEDDALREEYLADQRRYVKTRWDMMLPEDKIRIEELGFTDMFERYGIGGISQWDKVRCLHMQFAHYLADGNVIGRLLDQEFQLTSKDYAL